jgi:serine/threonine protein kinase
VKRPPGRVGPVRLPWATRIRLAAEVANALHYLHTQRPEGVLHRGVRPSNVLLNDDSSALLGDVGLSTFLQEGPQVVRKLPVISD